MQVRQILSFKLLPGVATIQRDARVSEAASEMAARRIGALVVSSDGTTVDGILSERDIVRELGRRGPVCLSDMVGQIMTREIQTCQLDDRADDILSLMTEGRFRHMPVMQGGKMVALISIGDVIKARLSELTMEKKALEDMIMGF
ncbi:CBS domain protein [Rhodovulum sp. P5]|uniref:CBS domain-containing protein n=1 Tax=Rhodovulum sp. P5 TaxID=1564506 RepID=UPI0009C3D021|nr:CBS domain-containing protein [Rhodovulum sp. P5]ARE42054.1 CBS domain protein [Rhodovulum sp. P5]